MRIMYPRTRVEQAFSTQSSRRWSSLPGNWDRLNCRALYPGDPDWGIPVLPAALGTPAHMVAYNDRRGCASAEPGSAVHFFLDDYRFETVWSKPERGLSRVSSVGWALTPDFSLWREMPKAMQLWQTYRARWCGAWMLSHGIQVTPTVSWSTSDSYGYAFAGLTRGSVVAVSTVGCGRDGESVRLFRDGYREMVDRVAPVTVLVYGNPPADDLASLVDVRMYPTRWKGRVRGR